MNVLTLVFTMSSNVGVPRIVAVRFKETSSGKHFSFSKVRTEYTILIDNRQEVVIEVTNSRLARKKSIIMNGEVVESFKKTSIGSLRHSWTLPWNGKVIVFSVAVNSSSSGSDLLINGKDFFDYVFQIDTTNPTGQTNRVYDTVMNFIVPPAVPTSRAIVGNRRPSATSVQSQNDKTHNATGTKYNLPVSSGYASLEHDEDSSEKDSKDLIRY